MRVAYVCADPGVPVFGRKGCSIHVRSILRELVRAGCEVDLFARRLGGEPTDELVTVRVQQLPRITQCVASEREQALAAGNRDLRIQLEQQGPYDLVYERYALWSYSAMQYAADGHIPSILEINAPLVREQLAHRELVDVDQATELSKLAFESATLLLAVSQGVADHIRHDFVRLRAGQLHVVPNGVDPEALHHGTQVIAARIASDDSDHHFTIGFVGTLRAWHGMDTLGTAFAELHSTLPDARLLIVGDGSARQQLEAALPPRGNSAVTITGAIDPHQVPEWMSRMDVGVAPYRPASRFYFSPLKIMEYLAAGLPVVSSTASTFDSLLDEHNALFFEAGHAGGLAAALRRLHDDRLLRARLARSSYDSLQSQHTWTGVLQQALCLAGVGLPSSATVRSAG